MEKTYWQIAAGSRDRDYSGYFLRYGIAFVGGEENCETMEQVNLGDVMILKSGLRKILAVGEVVERDGSYRGIDDKFWLRDFDGWELPAYCYVDWHVPEEAIETSGLTRTAIERTHQPNNKKLADSILNLLLHSRENEPDETEVLDDETVLSHLVAEGLPSSSAVELTNMLRRIRLLAWFYYTESKWEDVREQETRAFLVLPLLLALGWSEQQLKVELPCSAGTVDVACFSRPYKRRPKDCVLIVETKDFSKGLDYAPDQARRYAEDFPSCRTLLVSNGQCYKSYRRKREGNFDEKATAYLNILEPRDRYPLDPKNVDGALGVLSALLPGAR